MLNDSTINRMLSEFKNNEPVYVEIVRGPRTGSIAKVVNIPKVPQREAWRIQLDGKRSYVSNRLLAETDAREEYNSTKVVKDHYDILGRRLEVGQTVAYIGPLGQCGQEICIGSIGCVDMKVTIIPKVAPTIRKLGDFRTAKSNTSILIVDNNELEPFILEKIFTND